VEGGDRKSLGKRIMGECNYKKSVSLPVTCL
jgi:hypothetical protein